MSAAHLELLALLVVREVRARYARAALGVAWAVVPPLVTAAAFSALGFETFGREARGGVPYPAFAFCGLVFWTHLSQSLTTGTTSLVLARDMLHKSKFPAELVPLSKVIAWLLDLAIGCALLVALMLLGGMGVPATALLVPAVFAVQLAFTVGIVLLLSALNLFFRDVQFVLQAAVLILLFASNVVYPVDAAAGRAAGVLALNPVVSYLSAYRSLLFLGELPTLRSLVPGIVGAALALAIGAWYFRRVSPRFPEEV